MSVRRKGNGFEVRVYVGLDPATGRKKYASKYVSDKEAGGPEKAEKLARKIEAELTRQVETNTYVPPAKQTVGEFLDTWLAGSAKPTVKPGTYRRYEEMVRLYIKPHIGAVRLDKLTPQHVAMLLARLHEEGVSDRGRLYVYRTLHRALEIAVRWGLVGRNVCDAVEPPKVAERPPVGLREAEVQALLRAAEGDRLHPLFMTAVMTGLRKGELLALKWEDVDLHAGTLTVCRTLEKGGPNPVFGTPKNRKGRVITLDPVVVETLRKWRVDQEIERAFFGEDYQDHGLVFCQPDGRPLDGRSLVRWHFKRLLKKAGLSASIRFHDLRHTFVSRALQAGANVGAVSELAGHHDPGFTVKRYAHAFDEDKKEAVERLSRRLFGNGTTASQ